MASTVATPASGLDEASEPASLGLLPESTGAGSDEQAANSNEQVKLTRRDMRMSYHAMPEASARIFAILTRRIAAPRPDCAILRRDGLGRSAMPRGDRSTRQ